MNKIDVSDLYNLIFIQIQILILVMSKYQGFMIFTCLSLLRTQLTMTRKMDE